MPKKELKRKRQKHLHMDFGLEETKHTSITLPKSQYDFVKLQCKIHNTSINSYIRQLIYDRMPIWMT